MASMPAEPGCGQLAHHPGQVGTVEAQAVGVGQDGHAARGLGQARPPRAGQPGLGHVSRAGRWPGTGRRRRRSTRPHPTSTRAAAKWGRPTPPRRRPRPPPVVGDGDARGRPAARPGPGCGGAGPPAAGPAPRRAGPPSSSTKYTSTCMPPGPTGRHETSHPGTKVIPSSSARRRAGPRPASESWSVRATALHPASAASSTIRSGGRSRPRRWSGCAGRSPRRRYRGRCRPDPAGAGGRATPGADRRRPAAESLHRPPTSLEWHGEAIVWPNRGERRARRPPVCAVTNR